jgi:hypothetical protein
MGTDIKRLVDMTIDPAEEKAPRKGPEVPPVIQKGAVAPEEYGDLSFIMPEHSQVRGIVPAEHEDGVRSETIDLPDDIGVDDPPEMV